jgi:hypothetical protein
MSDVLAQRDLTRRLEQTQVIERARTNYGPTKPTSPATNVPFFDTTAGFWVYYDGARWLTVAEYPYVVLPWQTFSVSNTFTDILIRTDYAPAITRVVTATNVTAPNSGVAFWNVVIAGINTARSASTTIEIFDTHLDTAGVETLRDNVPNSSTLPTQRTYIRCVATKTGAPGNMTIAHTIYIKLIIP